MIHTAYSNMPRLCHPPAYLGIHLLRPPVHLATLCALPGQDDSETSSKSGHGKSGPTCYIFRTTMKSCFMSFAIICTSLLILFKNPTCGSVYNLYFQTCTYLMYLMVLIFTWLQLVLCVRLPCQLNLDHFSCIYGFT